MHKIETKRISYTESPKPLRLILSQTQRKLNEQANGTMDLIPATTNTYGYNKCHIPLNDYPTINMEVKVQSGSDDPNKLGHFFGGLSG